MPEEELGVEVAEESPAPAIEETPGEVKAKSPVPDENRVAEARRKQDAAETRATRAEQELEFRRQADIEKLAAERTTKAKPVITDEALRTLWEEDPVKAMKEFVASQREELLPEVERAVSYRIAAEGVRKEVIKDFPELLDKTSPFFKDVANYIAVRPHLGQDPEGLRIAVDAIDLQHRKAKDRAQTDKDGIDRKFRGKDASGIEGKGHSVVTEEGELDDQGKTFSEKIGVDPKKIAARLKANPQYRQGRR